MVAVTLHCIHLSVGDAAQSATMAGLAVFTCHPSSHPFQERRVTLKEPVKIGRSVAKARPASDNGIFDCKVLSRNHALIWYEQDSGKVGDI